MQICRSILIWRSSYSGENHFHVINDGRKTCAEMKSSGLYVSFYEFLKSRFVNRYFTFSESFDFVFVDVDTGNVYTCF